MLTIVPQPADALSVSPEVALGAASTRTEAEVRALLAPPVKLCIDCRHFISEDERCGHETAIVVDRVYGKNRKFAAASHRNWNGPKDCGPEARYFSPLVTQ